MDGVSWLRSNGQWQNRNYEPQVGDIIFFDWDGDGTSDHVGIVEKCKTAWSTLWRATPETPAVGDSILWEVVLFLAMVCRRIKTVSNERISFAYCTHWEDKIIRYLVFSVILTELVCLGCKSGDCNKLYDEMF